LLKFDPYDDDIVSTTYLWIVLSKLIIDDDESFKENHEQQSDYLAVQLLENKHRGGVLHTMKNIIQKNVFTSELTYTSRILIPSDKVNRKFNLIITQDSRK